MLNPISSFNSIFYFDLEELFTQTIALFFSKTEL